MSSLPPWLNAILQPTQDRHEIALYALENSPLNGIYDFECLRAYEEYSLNAKRGRLLDLVAGHVDMLQEVANNPKATIGRVARENTGFRDEPKHHETEDQFFKSIWEFLEKDLQAKAQSLLDQTQLEQGRIVAKSTEKDAVAFAEFLCAQGVEGTIDASCDADREPVSSRTILNNRIVDIVEAVVDNIDRQLRAACKAPDMRIR